MIGTPWCLFLWLVVGPGSTAAEPTGEIRFVESWPAETSLDNPRIADSPAVWLEMITAARATIDIETFYLSGRPDGPGALAPILAALGEAADRGVRIRCLSDAGFYRPSPETPARLGALPGAESRRLDARQLGGGVQHAKCFLVDSSSFFLGSQNWDWRALEHIHELGVEVHHAGLAADLGRIFALDWSLAAGEATPLPATAAGRTQPSYRLRLAGKEISAILAASPPRALPAGIPWDEPLLVELMDSARERIRLQLLSYDPVDRDSERYPVLDDALRRAAARGVQVQILLANWSKRRYMLPEIKDLAAVPNLEIRFTNIPEWSSGFVPYSRVEHAKYLVADDRACWIGTANWSRSYFHSSRNISLFLYGEAATVAPGEFFAGSWHGPYAESVDPDRDYEPPRIGK